MDKFSLSHLDRGLYSLIVAAAAATAGGGGAATIIEIAIRINQKSTTRAIGAGERERFPLTDLSSDLTFVIPSTIQSLLLCFYPSNT